MIDANILSEKLKQLAERTAKARARCPEDPEELAHDSDTLDLVSFNLLVSVQTCLDLATHLIAGEGWAPAATAREAFERLGPKPGELVTQDGWTGLASPTGGEEDSCGMRRVRKLTLSIRTAAIQ